MQLSGLNGIFIFDFFALALGMNVACSHSAGKQHRIFFLYSFRGCFLHRGHFIQTLDA